MKDFYGARGVSSTPSQLPDRLVPQDDQRKQTSVPNLVSVITTGGAVPWPSPAPPSSANPVTCAPVATGNKITPHSHVDASHFFKQRQQGMAGFPKRERNRLDQLEWHPNLIHRRSAQSVTLIQRSYLNAVHRAAHEDGGWVTKTLFRS